MPERILGHNPWRRASLFIIGLCLVVLFLAAGLVDQRNEVVALKARESERERAVEVTQAVQCFTTLRDAPLGTALFDFLDRNARNRIAASRRLILTDPDRERNMVRRKTIRDDRRARDAIRALRARALLDVRPLGECLKEANRLDLDPEELGFDLQRLSMISRTLDARR